MYLCASSPWSARPVRSQVLFIPSGSGICSGEGAVNVVVGSRGARGEGGCSPRGVSEGAPGCPQPGCQPEEKGPRAAGVQGQGRGGARRHQKQSSRVRPSTGGVRPRPRGGNTRPPPPS